MPNLKDCCEEFSSSQALQDCIIYDSESGVVTLDKHEVAILVRDLCGRVFESSMLKAARIYGSFRKIDGFSKNDIKRQITSCFPPDNIDYSMQSVSHVLKIQDKQESLCASK